MPKYREVLTPVTIRNLVASPLALFLSTLLMVATAVTFNPSKDVVHFYWALAFWATVGFDFYRTQVLEDGATELSPDRIRFTERFLANIFVAPFFLPARLLRLSLTGI